MMKRYSQAAMMCFCILFAVNALAASASDTKFYRYKDESGQIILSNQVPPDQVKRGYEVLDQYGKIEETIAPALTQEQRDANAAEEARAANDKRLRLLYSNYEEIDKARDLEVGKIKSAQVIIEGNIKNLVSRRTKTQEAAANLERSGKPVPPETSKELFTIDYHIKIEKGKLEAQKELEKKELEKFAADRARLGELLNLGGVNKTPDNQLKSLPNTTSKP